MEIITHYVMFIPLYIHRPAYFYFKFADTVVYDKSWSQW